MVSRITLNFDGMTRDSVCRSAYLTDRVPVRGCVVWQAIRLLTQFGRKPAEQALRILIDRRFLCFGHTGQRAERSHILRDNRLRGRRKI
jgi:hypothetical protein